MLCSIMVTVNGLERQAIDSKKYMLSRHLIKIYIQYIKIINL